MNKYIKKPVEIEAFKLGIDNIPDWFMDKVSTNEIILHGTSTVFEHCEDTNADIKTLEGVMHANFGDYIIKGVNGEIYPCKPDIFEKTYDKTPTFEEVKKEWEELGYGLTKHTRRFLEFEKGDRCIMLYNYGAIKYEKYGYNYSRKITFQEHQLLTKTFRALGWEV